MNVIAFGLWGGEAKYIKGAFENARLVPAVYAGWELHVWVERQTVPGEVTLALADWGAALHDFDPAIRSPYCQRFLVHDLPGVTRYLIRDFDSRVSDRERACVEEWCESGALLHTIHDHPYHFKGPAIMGGLWGFYRAADSTPFQMREQLLSSPHAARAAWGSDQDFLAEFVWPRYRQSCVQHGKTRPFPSANVTDPNAFCGEILDAEGRPNADHRALRRAVLNAR